jgi:fucose 4-O-acetylase-like acetyltransferase
MASIIDKHGNVAFFGKLSWANTVDWMVTFCLGGIIMLTTIKLGGVRPDTHLAILPLYAILLTLHGLWFVLNRVSQALELHPPALHPRALMDAFECGLAIARSLAWLV